MFRSILSIPVFMQGAAFWPQSATYTSCTVRQVTESPPARYSWDCTSLPPRPGDEQWTQSAGKAEPRQVRCTVILVTQTLQWHSARVIKCDSSLDARRDGGANFFNQRRIWELSSLFGKASYWVQQVTYSNISPRPCSENRNNLFNNFFTFTAYWMFARKEKRKMRRKIRKYSVQQSNPSGRWFWEV